MVIPLLSNILSGGNNDIIAILNNDIKAIIKQKDLEFRLVITVKNESTIL